MKQRSIPDEIIAQFSAADDIFKQFRTPEDELEQIAETLLYTELPTNKAFHHTLISRLLEDCYYINFLQTKKIDYIVGFLGRFELDLLFDSTSSNLTQTCFNIFYVYVSRNADNQQLLELYNRIYGQLYENLARLLEDYYAAKFMRAVYAVELGVYPESLKTRRRTHANDAILEYLATGKCLIYAQKLTEALIKFCKKVGFKQAGSVLETSQIMYLYIAHFRKLDTSMLPSPCQMLGEFLYHKYWRRVLEVYNEKYSFDLQLYYSCVEVAKNAICENRENPEVLHFLSAAVYPQQNAYYAGAFGTASYNFEQMQPLQLQVHGQCILNTYYYREIFIPIIENVASQMDVLLTVFDNQPIIENCFKVFARTKDTYKDYCIEFIKRLKETTGSETYFLKRLMHPGAADNAPLKLVSFKSNERYNYDMLKQYGDAESLRALKRETWVKIKQYAKEYRFGEVYRPSCNKQSGCFGFWRCGENIALAMLDLEFDWFIAEIISSFRAYFELSQEQLMMLVDHPGGVDFACKVFSNKGIPFELKAGMLDKLRGYYRELCFSKLGLLFLQAVGQFLLTSYSENVPLELQVDIMELILKEITARAVVNQLQRRDNGMAVFKTFRVDEYLQDRIRWQKGIFSTLKVLERKYRKENRPSKLVVDGQYKSDEM